MIIYLQETNVVACQWLMTFMNANPITLSGSWEEISGDAFLKKLLSMPVQEHRFQNGCEDIHNNFSAIAVDPRSIAQRILEVRAQLAKELIQDVALVPEDNDLLLQQSLLASLESSFRILPTLPPAAAEGPVHPELMDQRDSN